MDNIINKIIEIEQEAQKIDKEAAQIKEQFPRLLNEKTQQLRNEIEQKTNEEIEKYKKTTLSPKIDVTDNSQLLNDLEKKYDENHIAWEDDIIKKVLN